MAKQLRTSAMFRSPRRRAAIRTAMLLSLLGGAGTWGGCDRGEPVPPDDMELGTPVTPEPQAPPEQEPVLSLVPEAVCVLVPTQTSLAGGVRGTVRFEQRNGGLYVSATLFGLDPGTNHRLVLHEFGDLTGGQLGASIGSPYFAGDEEQSGLGEVQAGPDGVVVYTHRFTDLSIAGHDFPVLGRSVAVVRLDPEVGDDLASAPILAVGVIGQAWIEPAPAVEMAEDQPESSEASAAPETSPTP